VYFLLDIPVKYAKFKKDATYPMHYLGVRIMKQKNQEPINQTTTKQFTYDEWLEEGERRFGKDKSKWKFKCPSCGHVASVQDYLNANAEDSIGFSCIGRYIGAEGDFLKQNGSPCNYAGGGLLRINPMKIKDHGDFFEFA
jgi:hypothetical protein